MIFGFLGTGTITDAIVTGLMATDLPVTRIVVSPRNAAVAADLAARIARVEVAADNQAVVDAADVLFLAVRPQVAKEVLTGLRFDRDQTIVSLIAATDHASLKAWTAPNASIVRAIPLPFVAERRGVTAIFPADPQTQQIFDALGSAVACETREEFDLLAAASSLMATYFGIMDRTTEWLVDRGFEEARARAYLAPLFQSLADTAVNAPQTRLARLREMHSTAGGLNEQVFQDFDARGGTRSLIDALDRVHRRITGD
jgi:pyrroline-5-carboxylate reductase